MSDGLTRSTAFSIGVTVFALDRLSKYLVEQNLAAYDIRTAIPGFLDIVKSQNPGVAFGFLAGSTSALRTALLIAFSLAALITVGVMLWRAVRLDQPTAVGLALIFGARWAISVTACCMAR